MFTYRTGVRVRGSRGRYRWGCCMGRQSLQGLGVKQSATVAYRVPKSLLRSWNAYAAARGQSPGVALRELMAERVGQPLPPPVVPAPAPPPAPVAQEVGRLDRGRTKRMELRLTPTEHDAVARIAAQQECGPHYWITSLVRAAITGTPHFGMTQARALADSNYQLMAIGRNLNQIAHHLNADPTTTNRVKVEHIEVLNAEIDKHRAQVGALMQACSGRWAIAAGEPSRV